MQKHKRKIGQRNFWQKLYSEFILLRHEFRYELERNPQKIAKELRLFWQHKYNKLLSPKELREITSGELSVFDLTVPDNLSQIQGEIYLEDEKTIFEGIIEYRTTILAELFILSILSIVLVIPLSFYSVSTFYRIIIFIALVGMGFFTYINHLVSKGRFDDALRLINFFVAQGKFISEEVEDLAQNEEAKILFKQKGDS